MSYQPREFAAATRPRKIACLLDPAGIVSRSWSIEDEQWARDLAHSAVAGLPAGSRVLIGSRWPAHCHRCGALCVTYPDGYAPALHRLVPHRDGRFTCAGADSIALALSVDIYAPLSDKVAHRPR